MKTRTLVNLEGKHSTVLHLSVSEVQMQLEDQDVIPNRLVFFHDSAKGDNGIAIKPDKVVSLIDVSIEDSKPPNNAEWRRRTEAMGVDPDGRPRGS